MLCKNKIAIIYFSRTVAQEAEHKKWSAHNTKKQRVAISKFLNSRALHTIQNSGLEVLCFDETKQKGNNFGEKVANAFDSTFSLGYESAIMVGNDCLNLPSVDFEIIANTLMKGRNVIGPTHRKGAYLIGLNKKDFDKERFNALSWQTTGLEQELLSYFESKSTSVEILETFRDANNLKDFKDLLKSLGSSAIILKNLQHFISFEVNRLTEAIKYFVAQRTFNFENLRAPPFSC